MMSGKKLFTCLLLLIVLSIPTSSIYIPLFNSEAYDIKTQSVPSVSMFPGNRWDVNGLSIIYLKGTFYEMGFQQATLLKEEILKNRRAFTNFYESEGIFIDDLVTLWNTQKDFVCDEIIDFIRGMSDALGIPFEEVACTWVAEGFSYMRCCSMAAWDSATSNGELIQLRSMEFPLNIRDPISGRYIQDSPVLVVANPDNYYGFMYPTFAGYVIEDGINENGIAVANMWSNNHDQNQYGAPMGIRLFEALFKSTSADEAIDIITTNRTYGYNFVVSDSKIPIGYAVETTANSVYVGTWNDEAESIRPFWRIRDVIRRSNMFLNPETASLQREHYDPRHPSYILELLNGGEPWYYVWHHYKALSKGIQLYWGNMDINNTMEMLRNVYHGSFDVLWRFMLSLAEKETWWQWVSCPATGEMIISFANRGHSAYRNPVFHISLKKVLEDETPF